MPKAPKGKGGGGVSKGMTSTLQAAGGRYVKAAKKTATRRPAEASNPPPVGVKPRPVLGSKGKPTTVQETPSANRPVPGERQTTYWQAHNLPNSRGKRGMDHALQSDDEVRRNAAEVGRRRAELLHYQRQNFTQGQRNQVWDNYFGKDTKSGTDVGDRTIHRDDEFDAMKKDGRLGPKEPRWQMGHVGGHEHWKNVQNAIDDGVDPKAFKDDYMDVDNYRPEHQKTNGSHQHEDD